MKAKYVTMVILKLKKEISSYFVFYKRHIYYVKLQVEVSYQF